MRQPQRSPFERVRTGATLLATAVLLGTIGYRYLGDYSWLEAFYPKLVGKTVQDTEAQRTHHLLFVAVRDGEGKLLANPGADYVFQSDDVYVLMGNPNHISKFRRHHS